MTGAARHPPPGGRRSTVPAPPRGIPQTGAERSDGPLPAVIPQTGKGRSDGPVMRGSFREGAAAHPSARGPPPAAATLAGKALAHELHSFCLRSVERPFVTVRNNCSIKIVAFSLWNDPSHYGVSREKTL